MVVKLSISAVLRWTPGLWEARFTVESQIACYLVKWGKTFLLKAFWIFSFLPLQ